MHGRGVCRALTLVSFAAGVLAVSSCTTRRGRRGWYILRWVERPGSGKAWAATDPADRVVFEPLFSHERGATDFPKLKEELKPGDLIAYRMTTKEARKQLAKGDLTKVGYRLLDYGHLGMIIENPSGAGPLLILSSHSFRGPNTNETVDTLAEHSWDAFRLNQSERVNTARLREFVLLAKKEAGAWYGYDFSGMFGMWNSNLRPRDAKDIGHDYICSTVVLAALYYAGVELDTAHRHGILDVVTPKQLVTSKGRIIPTPAASVSVEYHRSPH